MTTATAKHDVKHNTAPATTHSTTTGPVKATTKIKVKHLKDKVAKIKATATSDETKDLATMIDEWCNDVIAGDDSSDSDDDAPSDNDTL